jgi:hypothetical protein
MKFTVDVEDFYLEDGELSAELVRVIKEGVINQMKKNVEDRIDAQIVVKVTGAINDYLDLVIKNKLNELLETGTIIKSGKVIKITDHINELFVNNQGWDNPRNQIAALAKKFGEELKQRYDAIFANRIVVKLNEQGMLKDEVVKMLINQP